MKLSNYLKKILIFIIPVIIIIAVFSIFFIDPGYTEIRMNKLENDSLVIPEFKQAFGISNLFGVYVVDIYLKDFSKMNAEKVTLKYLDEHKGKTYMFILYMFEKNRLPEDPVEDGTRYYLSYLLPQQNRYHLEDEKLFQNIKK